MDNTAWVFCDKPFEIKDLDQYWGFVYKIKNIKTGEFYIGSKSFFNRTNGKISKKRSNELYSGKGRKPSREKKIKESDWKSYKSSSKKVQEMVSKNPKDFRYEIHNVYKTKAEMLLVEAYLIIMGFMFRDPLILNDWISIKSFKLK